MLKLLACTDGMYGDNCSTPCGHCFESQQCDNVNGTCLNGCDSGYKGISCTEGKHTQRHIY